VAVVLPVDGPVTEATPSALADRVSVIDLWPPDAIVFTPAGAHLEPELRRTWDEAQHHGELARRRGEDTPPREDLYQSPDRTLAALAALATLAEDEGAQAAADVPFPLRPPEPVDRDIARLGRIVRDGIPTLILCDNAGQCERLDELLAGRGRDGGPGNASPATLAVGVLDGGFVVPPTGTEGGIRVLTDHEIFRRERRIRRARRYGGGVSLESITALRSGDYGGRVRGWRPTQRAAIPHRPARTVSGRGRRLRGRAAAATAPARRQAVGPAARSHAGRDPGDDRRAARSLRAAAGGEPAAARK
jgi:transcription-repair coupling factor (superfamily II helicase)